MKQRTIICGRAFLVCAALLWFGALWSMISRSPVSSAHGLYFELILLWSIPILIFQWTYGYFALLSNLRVWVKTVVFSTASLAIADQWAIRGGIWSIDDRFSLGHMTWIGLPDLPVEEFVFFLATSLMCSWGLTLAMVVSFQARINSAQDTFIRSPFQYALMQVYAWNYDAESRPHRTKRRLNDPWTYSWMQDNAEKLHSVFASAICVAVIILTGATYDKMSIVAQTKWFLCTSVVFGMPHGALDPILVQGGLVGLRGASFGCFFSRVNISALLRGWMPYLSLMLLTYACWIYAPVIALGIFLCLSILHFGEGDVVKGGVYLSLRSGLVEMFARGGAFLIAVEWHPMQVTSIFSAIVQNASTASLLDFLHVLYIIQFASTALVICAHMWTINETHSLLVIFEMVFINMLFRFCPPLIAFAVYFNAFHSLRHIIRVTRFSPQLVAKRGATVAAVFTLVCVVPIFCIIRWNGHADSPAGAAAPSRGDISFWLRAAFIGLSVVTTPHMFLVGLLHFTEKKNGEPSDAALPLLDAVKAA